LDLSKAQQNILAEKARAQDIVTAEADIIKQRVSLKLAEDNLKDTRITAPISGTILEKSVEEGQVISSGMSISSTGTTIAKMANLAKVYIDANVDETDIAKIMLQQQVKIVVDSFPKEIFKGVVIRIAPQGVVVQNVTTFAITVEIKNPSIILKPGMNASLEVVSAERKNIIFVPNDTVKLKDGKATVNVIQNGQPVTREVKTGISNWEFTEILAGLEEGDIVSKAELKGKKGSDSTRRPPSLFGGGH
jgi:HlyD family secretion protein